MAGLVLTDALILAGGLSWCQQIDTYANHVTVGMSADFDDGTTFGKTTKVKNPAALDSDLTVRGYVDYDAVYYARPEKVLWAKVGVAGCVFTVAPNKVPTLGDRHTTLLGTLSKWTCLGEHGKTAPFELGASGSRYIIRGPTLKYGALTTGAYAGTAYNYGAVPAGSELVGVVHIPVWNATSITINFQSSATEGGSYTTRLAMTTQTSVASELKNWTGGTTDAWWKVTGTVAGTGCTLFAGIWCGTRTRGGGTADDAIVIG